MHTTKIRVIRAIRVQKENKNTRIITSFWSVGLRRVSFNSWLNEDICVRDGRLFLFAGGTVSAVVAAEEGLHDEVGVDALAFLELLGWVAAYDGHGLNVLNHNASTGNYPPP